MRTIIMCKYWLRLSLTHAIEIQVYTLTNHSNELYWDLRETKQLPVLMVPMQAWS